MVFPEVRAGEPEGRPPIRVRHHARRGAPIWTVGGFCRMLGSRVQQPQTLCSSSLVSRSVLQMPFSQWIAKSNRYIANPVLGLLAGKIGPLAVLEHTGRRSGKRRTIPIMAFRKTDGFLIALTYGPKTDWVRNVLAAGSTAITVRRQRYELNNPVLFEADPASVGLSAPVVFFLKRLGVRDFLRLTDTSR